MSNNDVMIDELEDQVLKFGGRATHPCCFLHMVNLIAKSLVCEFDVKKWRDGEYTRSEDEDAERLEQELRTLADGIELEERATVDENDLDGNNEFEGWIDEIERLTNEEWKEFHETVRSVKLALVKVKHTRKKHLPTIDTCAGRSGNWPSRSCARTQSCSWNGNGSWRN